MNKPEENLTSILSEQQLKENLPIGSDARLLSKFAAANVGQGIRLDGSRSDRLFVSKADETARRASRAGVSESIDGAQELSVRVASRQFKFPVEVEASTSNFSPSSSLKLKLPTSTTAEQLGTGATKPYIAAVEFPKKSIGILGSGQLGQMMAIAAKKLGYQVVIFDTVADGPALAYADVSIVARFDDQEALARFANNVDLITLEFENIPAATLKHLASQRPLYPAPEVVGICQDRVREKEFLRSHGFPVAPFYVVRSAQELSKALNALQGETILKTATLGYDGKGQLHLRADDDALIAWSSLKTDRAVLEKKIDFIGEASVICARSTSGEISCFPMQENIHRNGILDRSITPPRFEKTIAEKAETMGRAITEALDVIGLLTVEFFVLADGSLMVNELAPRPHNSGHHTLDSSKTSQFEQIIRAVCGLPLGSPELQHCAVMVNLLGDLWSAGEPNWNTLSNNDNVVLHLYGKKEPKPGRKMGHFTLFGNNREELIKHTQSLFEGLLSGD